MGQGIAPQWENVVNNINTLGGDRCPKCINERYASGITLMPPYTHTWIKRWLGMTHGPGMPIKGWMGQHEGCFNVGLQHIKVLGILLYKLDIKRGG